MFVMNNVKKSEDISGEEYKPSSDTKACIWVLFKKTRLLYYDNNKVEYTYIMMMSYFKGAGWCLHWHIHVRGRFGIYMYSPGSGVGIYILTRASLYHILIAKSINNVTRNLNNRLWVRSTIVLNVSQLCHSSS